jgi:hypothetical protein
MKQKGLEFELPAGPLPVVMLDPIVHTPAFPCCHDPECICGPLEDARVRAEYEASKKAKRTQRTKKPLVAKSYEAKKIDTIHDALNPRPFRIERC